MAEPTPLSETGDLMARLEALSRRPTDFFASNNAKDALATIAALQAERKARDYEIIRDEQSKFSTEAFYMVDMRKKAERERDAAIAERDANDKEIAELKRENRILTAKNEGKKRQIDRWVPCPDHRDKFNMRPEQWECQVCRRERAETERDTAYQRGRDEQRTIDIMLKIGKPQTVVTGKDRSFFMQGWNTALTIYRLAIREAK